MINYLKLYRIDVVLISLFSFLVGAQIAGGLDYTDLIYALLITLFSMNFVYSINSWADWKIDAINKPDRPIPSGKVSPRSAFIYGMVLLGIALIFPFFIYKSWLSLGLLLALPILGYVYSFKPFRFKEHLIPAVITTSLVLIVPMTAGYFMNSSDTSMIPFFVVLFIYCLTIVPLKDIEDISGDTENKSKNWLAVLGERKLLLISLVGLIINLVLVYLFDIETILKVYLYTFLATTFSLILIFIIFKLNITRLYKTIIKLVIIEGIIMFVILNYVI